MRRLKPGSREVVPRKTSHILFTFEPDGKALAPRRIPA